MKLLSFRILNCFGFVDSGEIDLYNPHNLIYILGRNSSGKTSLLSALRSFAHGERPDADGRFQNFNEPNGPVALRARLAIEVGDFRVESAMQALQEKAFIHPSLKVRLSLEQNDDTFRATPTEHFSKLQPMIDGIQKMYSRLVDHLSSLSEIEIEKRGDGTYRFCGFEGDHEYEQRQAEFTHIVEKALGPPKQYIIQGTSYPMTASFDDLEQVLFSQLPKIFLFDQGFSLKEDLPHYLTEEHLKSDPKSLTGRLLDVIGRDNVRQWIGYRDQRKQQSLQSTMQKKVEDLYKKVNESQQAMVPDEEHFFKIILNPHNWLEIIAETDGKQSYYEHLSDNTKLLFAYHLVRETENLHDAVLLFDEPNAGFHPSAEKMVLQFLESLADAGNLVILTTHSQHMIDLDRFSSIRLMDKDEDNMLAVSNHTVTRGSEHDRLLALQPVMEAIGFSIGSEAITNRKVVVTEGFTDFLYLKTFRRVLGYSKELHIMPVDSESRIVMAVAFLLSQGISSKVVLDSKDMMRNIQRSLLITDKYFFPIPKMCGFEDRNMVGIEDRFSRKDFRKLLSRCGHRVDEARLEHEANSAYAKANGSIKVRMAIVVYEQMENLTKDDFDDETLNNFREILDFCYNDNWFAGQPDQLICQDDLAL